MPFYQPDNTLRRLSVDVDLSTMASLDCIDAVMMGAKVIPNVTDILQYHPRQARPKKNLITYSVHYRSCFGQERAIKVDILHGLDIGYDTSTVPTGTHIMAFKIPYTMNILSRGALMADKMGALAVGTVGLDGSRVGEITKQVFDVGSLLSGATVENMMAFFTEFFNMIKIEKIINDNPRLDARNVTNSVQSVLHQLVNVSNTVQLTPYGKKGYLDFKSTYVSKMIPYERIDHYVSILSVLMLSYVLAYVIEGEDVNNAARWMYRTLADVQRYQHIKTYADCMERPSAKYPASPKINWAEWMQGYLIFCVRRHA